MASFEYRPLQGNEIRLLQIVSAQTCHYTLVHVNINWNPRYAALSYTWGDTYSPEPVLLDNRQFWVTKNLRDALRRLQSHEQAIYLWVDAICINQLDDREKSHQIRMMGTIYERAHAVLVWLGEPGDKENASLAFRKIDYLDEIRKSHILKRIRPRSWWFPRKLEPAVESVSSMLSQISPFDKEIFDGPGTPTHRSWEGICSMLTCNWWKRTWVCQEATVQEDRTFMLRGNIITPPLARIEFLYGDFSTTWAKLINTADIGELLKETKGVDMTFMGDSQANFRRMMSVRAMRSENRELDLLEVMKTFRNTSCQNPRDKLYAPLCIASSSAQTFITTDYSKAVTEVYLDVAKYHLAQNKLDFLGFVTRFRPSPPNLMLEGWPSWLPDWREHNQCMYFGRILYVPEQPQRAGSSAMLDFKGTSTNVYTATMNSTVGARLVGLKLDVQGFLCDVVTEILLFKVVDGRNVTQQALARWDPSGKGKYFTREPFPKVLARIQAADAEYDFYHRICRRGFGIDFNLLTKGGGRRTPEYIQAY